MGFNINNFLNVESKKEAKSDWKQIKISVHKLRPAAGKENFYHMDDKEVIETARTIELVGLQQYPVVKPVEGTDEYEIIAGHKRRLAVMKLLSEGKPEYEMIPCKVENTEDSIRNRLILIFTNSTQRERTDYEKMQEIKETKELLKEWKRNNDLPGKMQNVIAEILGTNKTKVGTLENIDKNLIPAFKEEFAAGKISTNTANEIAGLVADAQQALYETYKETGSLTASDAKKLKQEEPEAEQITGQQNVYQFPDWLPEELQEEIRQYVEDHGVSVEEAAIAVSKRQNAQKPEKEPQMETYTPEPAKGRKRHRERP
ncbi:MAG: ParB/RepB/Spo0J family partition protein [[Ruminococcus] torques]